MSCACLPQRPPIPSMSGTVTKSKQAREDSWPPPKKNITSFPSGDVLLSIIAEHGGALRGVLQRIDQILPSGSRQGCILQKLGLWGISNRLMPESPTRFTPLPSVNPGCNRPSCWSKVKTSEKVLALSVEWWITPSAYSASSSNHSSPESSDADGRSPWAIFNT